VDDTPDNIHIRIADLPSGVQPTLYQVDDFTGGGRWVHPCNQENWWLVPEPGPDGTVDLFLKPHRDAPEGTEYIVTVRYDDGTHHRAQVLGSAVRLRPEAAEEP
jgi:hypothetical protein